MNNHDERDIFPSLGVLAVDMSAWVSIPNKPLTCYPKHLKNSERPVLTDDHHGGCLPLSIWEGRFGAAKVWKDPVSGHVLEKSYFIHCCRAALTGFMTSTYGSGGRPVFHAYVHEILAVLKGIVNHFRMYPL
jgi:hypothetical protein